MKIPKLVIGSCDDVLIDNISISNTAKLLDANILFPSLDKPSKLKKKNIRTNINGPKMSPNVFFDII